MGKIILYCSVLILLILFGCKKEERKTTPKLSTLSVNQITSNTAVSGGVVDNDGGSLITSRGVVWSESTSPSIYLTTKTIDGSGLGTFISNLHALKPSTTYYVRAYANNSIGTSYGNEVSFKTTTLPLPILSTNDIINVSSYGATSGGTIISNAGSTITASGICWSTNANPTVALSTKTSDGNTNSFSSNLTGLAANTTYYVRAYATNSFGTAYGNLVSFKTKSLVVHDFNKISIPIGGNSWANYGAIISPEGLSNWSNPLAVCKTFIRLNGPGTIKVSLKVHPSNGNNIIKVTILNKSVNVPISGNIEAEFFASQWEVLNEGYLMIEVQGVTKTSTNFGVLSEILISGSAITNGTTYIPSNDDNMFYWGRRGVSLHLNYDVAGVNNIEWFYSEIKVPVNNDIIGSFYMANGFREGYFGIQVNSSSERRILFSIWSPFVTDDPSKIPPEDRVILVRKGKNVVAGSFGNEGSGAQSYLIYNWKSEVTYRFLVQGKPVASNYTQYTAWFYDPQVSKWIIIASWNRPKTSTYLKSIHSFLENFSNNTGNITRMGLFSNQWIKLTNGNWIEITKAAITGSNESRFRKDYSGGLSNMSFYLKTAGFFNQYTPLNQIFIRSASNIQPNIDFNTLE